MADYIDREKLLDDLSAAVDHRGMGEIIAQALMRYVKRQPAADVAQVVRCRDCKFMLPDVLPYVGKAYAVGLKCDLRDDYSICEGDYCSRGVRRGGDPDGR